MTKKQDQLVSFPIHVSSEGERLFDEMIHRPWAFCREIRGWDPSVDLRENSDCFLLEADLPGVKLEDVSDEPSRRINVLFRWIHGLEMKLVGLASPSSPSPPR